MGVLKSYFFKLQEILKAQSISYFILIILSASFILLMANAAFYSQSGIMVNWFVFGSISLFVASFILQSLLLREKCYPLFIFRVLIVILLVIQVGYRIQQYASAVHAIGTYTQRDTLLGHRIKPNLHNSWNGRTRRNDTIYNICFSSDSFSRRIPDDAFMEKYLMNPTHPNKHAMFFGCSFTFGEGLMYASTFPSLFESLNADYKSYNYGVPGYGPHQIALLFDKQINTINEEAVPEEKGFALYTYIDDHLNRVYGRNIYLRWNGDPSLVFIENDSLSIKRWSSTPEWYFKLVNEVNIFKMFYIGAYPKEEAFYKRFADIVNYIAKKYWELKPGNHFYVGIYPGYDKDLNWVQYLDGKIIVLRVEIPPDYDNKSKYEVHRYDYHPSGAANAYYAEELTRLMNEYE